MIKNEYHCHAFDLILKALRRRRGRAIRRKEKRLQRKVQRELNDQRNYILKESKKLFPKKDTKATAKEIDDMLDGIPDEQLTDVIIDDSAGAMKFGAETQIRKSKLGRFGISFALDHPAALQYLETDRPLVLAKMTQTVKDEIKPILQEALKTGQSYNDTAKIISDAYGFSRSRSQMIAVNEIGHAYGAGNSIPIQDAIALGKTAEKEWLTAGDDRVTDECAANESEGKIPFEDPFFSGDMEAPRDDHPRCRCDTLYEVE